MKTQKMPRIPEPELMDDVEQAEAYDKADFSAAHGARIQLFAERYGRDIAGEVLDLGCGSGDIVERFAKHFTQAHFTGVDGSRAMLDLSHRRIARAGLLHRVSLVEALIPSPAIPEKDYGVIMSHSLLHHLHQPEVLWETVKARASKHTFVFVADLRRPDTADAAQEIVDRVSANEPEVLRRDFYNSLCAAFTADEVRAQLKAAKLKKLKVEEAGEFHLLVYGAV